MCPEAAVVEVPGAQSQGVRGDGLNIKAKKVRAVEEGEGRGMKGPLLENLVIHFIRITKGHVSKGANGALLE